MKNSHKNSDLRVLLQTLNTEYQNSSIKFAVHQHHLQIALELSGTPIKPVESQIPEKTQNSMSLLARAYGAYHGCNGEKLLKHYRIILCETSTTQINT